MPGAVRAWLEQQPAERLRDLLAEPARRDPEAHRRLTALAVAAEGSPIDPAPYRAAVRDALATATFGDYGYMDYRDGGVWRDGVEAVLDDIDGF